MDSRSTEDLPIESASVDSEPVGVAVCELVSRVSGTAIRDLPPLGRTVDPDALDVLFRAGTVGGKIAFRYAGYDVLVTSDGTIELYREATVTK